ncbi:hypothetical protein E2562_017035 [Oryza meyeriana var. granulata]|uniref:Uncharacterized protein n=1 Tax=Oryza meyeriana var. granulata TaxID=110450 RepID=A0A6G1EBE6_9ORYZ|nr:hypothetical protein E2562_017035 [Oryza meyeriana var. granulata]
MPIAAKLFCLHRRGPPAPAMDPAAAPLGLQLHPAHHKPLRDACFVFDEMSRLVVMGSEWEKEHVVINFS